MFSEMKAKMFVIAMLLGALLSSIFFSVYLTKVIDPEMQLLESRIQTLENKLHVPEPKKVHRIKRKDRSQDA